MDSKSPKVEAGGAAPPATDPVQDAANWNNNLGSTVGAFVTALVQADGEAKDAHTARVLNLLRVPNAKFVADASLVGSSEPMQVSIDAPVIALTNIQPILIQGATIEMDMNVSSSVTDAQEQAVEASGSGSASVGWGPFKAQIQVSASMASKSSHTRASDFRSKTHASVTMVQGDTPEGLALIMESVHSFVNTATDINKQIVQAKLPEIVKAAEEIKPGPHS